MGGLLANILGIVIGSLVGITMGRGIPEKVKKTTMEGMAIVILLIGVKSALDGENTILTVISVFLGTVVGSYIDLNEKLERITKKISEKVVKGENKFVSGLLTSTLIFAIGAMAILGPIQSAITGDNSTLYSKSILDAITSMVLASTYGVGVIFSAVTVTIYQGFYYMIAKIFSATFFTLEITKEINGVGGVLLVGLGISILLKKDIKIVNMLPSIGVPIIYFLILRIFS